MQQTVKATQFGGGIFILDNFLSPEECRALIKRSEALGYEQAAIHTAEGDRLIKEARNNDRVVFDDQVLAGEIFQRAKEFLVQERNGWRLRRMNERFRFYRYTEGQKFAWHLDGTVTSSEGEETFVTFMMYLNHDFEGGSTDFNWERVEPRCGRALAFPHRLRHQGSPVSAGVKYVLRTDVFYSPPSS